MNYKLEKNKEKYKSLLLQLSALLEGEKDHVANAANISAFLKENCGYWWVGFYFVRGNELVLGPFQGPIACTRIGYGKGVCGTSWAKGETIRVNNVHEFPGHIACSAASQSEVVVPIFNKEKMLGVLDVDSEHLNDFSLVDQQFLESVASLYSRSL